MDQSQLSPEEIQDLISDPRMKDPKIRAQVLLKLGPDQQAFVASKFESGPPTSGPTAPANDSHTGLFKAAGGMAGMALPGLISAAGFPEIGLPMWALEALGGAIGTAGAGKAAGSDSPMLDAAEGAFPPLLGPGLGLAGRFIGSKVGGPLAGMAAGSTMGHPWLGMGAGRVAGPSIGAGLEKTGSALESAMPGSIIKRIFGQGASDLAAAGSMSAEDIAGLKAAGYSDDVIARMGRSPSGPPPAQGAKPGSGSVLRTPKDSRISGLPPGEDIINDAYKAEKAKPENSLRMQELLNKFGGTQKEGAIGVDSSGYRGNARSLGSPDTVGLRKLPNVSAKPTLEDALDTMSHGATSPTDLNPMGHPAFESAEKATKSLMDPMSDQPEFLSQLEESIAAAKKKKPSLRKPK